MPNLVTLFESGIKFIHARLTPRQFLIVSSMLVGLTAGLSAVLLKTFVHYIKILITYNYKLPFQLENYLYLIFPLIGVLLTVFIVQYFFKGKLGRGTANIIRSIVRKSGFLPRDQMYSHIFTSGITVGFGGSAGLESPIVTTGSAIGSNFAKTYHLIYKDRVLLLACGAAAGIAAAFNAPIAGVLFALEVLLVDASISAFIPLIIAAAIGALCSKIILGEGILLTFKLQEPFDYHNVIFYAILGVLAGFISVYYSRMYERIEKRLPVNKNRPYRNAIRGGLILAALILLFPTLFGEGYESIKMLADMRAGEILDKSIFSSLIENEWILLAFIGATMFVKVIAAAVTIRSGGNGGNFAPSLFVGAYLGYLFARLVNLTGITSLPVSNFTLVAMAGILTGVFHAPLTGIFLIAEITGGYELMIPLMLVSALSFTVVRYFEPLSIDAKKLSEKGNVLTHSKDTTILSSMKLDRIIDTDFVPVRPETTLGELTEVVAHSRSNIFPVLIESQQLVGVIFLDNIREILFKTSMYDEVTVRDLMRKAPASISSADSMHSIMKKFDDTHSWILPVVNNDRFAGFISKSDLLASYRKQLLRTSSRE